MIKIIATIILVIALITITAIYLYKRKLAKPGKYIWVGPGKDPFKE